MELEKKDNLDDHEIEFWKDCAKKTDSEWGENFRHINFYKSFFNFKELKGDLLEIGCGGMPIDTYLFENNNSMLDKIENFYIVDPIIDDLIKIKEYEYLTKYNYYSKSILNFDINKKFDSIVCLNMLDHMESGHFEFFEKIYNLLNKGGIFMIYFDQRSKYSEGHYRVDNFNRIQKFLSFYFNIKKESFDINPRHKDWGDVVFSYRFVGIKKA